MSAPIEREVKLRFTSAQAARDAVLAIGAVRIHERRRQSDVLADTPDFALRSSGCALRVRMDGGRSLVTFKGPVDTTAAVKAREELETTVGDGRLMLTMLERMGFQIWFRYEKYREEFSIRDTVVAIDETPVGTFVEIEGPEHAIATVAAALGRGPSDYILASYRALFVQHCLDRGIDPKHMVFGEQD
jgi:adenylate cyclase class 2